ncbi:MAG: hypothetical protein U1F52_04650 [Burkholderiales bacterium]
MTHPPHKVSALSRVVSMNEEIKRVIETAFRVNVMALNAILLARRAGVVARGFGVLSNELREFVHQLEASMRRLQDLTADTVTAVSEDARRRRLQRTLQVTAAELAGKSAGRASIMDTVLAAQNRWTEARRDRLGALNQSLLLSLSDADQLAQFGAVLARTAKIEAAYGGDFAGSLTEVASEFGNTIQKILTSLETLMRHNRERA